MPEPNPIWGLHAAPGAITGALVRRSGDGFELLDTFVVETPPTDAGVAATLQDLAARPGVNGRGSLTAAPDHLLAVGTGTIPSDELYLNDDEIYHHLHDFAPFEPGEGQMVYRSIGAREERKYLVAAISREALDPLEAVAAGLDEDRHGIALATPCVVRGARALGLVEGRTFLVDVQATQTAVIVVDGVDERRYLLASGMAECGDSMRAAELLAADLNRTLAYHAEVARRDDATDDAPPAGDVVLVGANATRMRGLLERALGDRLCPVSRRVGKPERTSDAQGAPLPDDVVHTHVGAIGAALEAFQPPDRRFVLRHPPDSVPAYNGPDGIGVPGGAAPLGRGGAPLMIGVGALALVALGAWAFLSRGDAPPITSERTTDGQTGSGTAGGLEPPAGPVEPTLDETAAMDATAARAALGLFALRVARGRAIAAACAALASGDPPHTPVALDIDDVRGTLRLTLTARVDGTITAEIRRRVRTAVEAMPEISHVSIDTPEGALRVRYRTPLAPRPEPGEGARSPCGWLDAPRPERDLPVPTLRLEGAHVTPAHARAVLLLPTVDAPALLTPDETAFAQRLRAATDEILALLPAGPTPAPELAIAGVDEGGAVRITVATPSSEDMPLERRRLPDGEWTAATTLPAGASEIVDHVPGASGAYAWRRAGAPDGTTVDAPLQIDVSVELIGYDPVSQRPLFRLSRTWRGTRIGADVDTAPEGGALRALHDGVVIDAGLTTVAVTTRIETESVTEPIPEIGPDGTIRRDDEGRPVLVERTFERSHEMVDVRARDARGVERTWVRKMTDG